MSIRAIGIQRVDHKNVEVLAGWLLSDRRCFHNGVGERCAQRLPRRRVAKEQGREGRGSVGLVTDVEKQPFRSMGFVSVIIVSALFALGLPLVLL